MTGLYAGICGRWHIEPLSHQAEKRAEMHKRISLDRLFLPIESGIAGLNKKNLSLLMASMVFSSVWLMITTEAPFTGYLSYLGASDLQYGVMMSLPYLGAAFQLIGARLLERAHLKTKLYRCAGILKGFLWTAVGLLPLFHGCLDPIVFAMILCVGAAMFGALVNMTLTTLLGIVVPGGILGRYLSGRSRVGTAANLVFGLVVSLLLDHLLAPYNYVVVFSFAGLCCMADALIVGKVQELPANGLSKAAPKPIRAGRLLKDRAFRRYVGFWVAWNFSYYLASPFNAKYCLGPLGMSFTQFTVCCNYLYYAITLCSLPFWGSFIDRFGCRKTIYVAFSGIGAVSCLWLFAKPGQMLVPVLFYGLGGTVWCVVELLNQHMMISQTPEEGRQQYVAVYSTCALVLGQGMATLAGGVVMGAIHGWIGEGRLPVAGLALDKYQLLFILASFLRFFVILFLAPRLQEREKA